VGSPSRSPRHRHVSAIHPFLGGSPVPTRKEAGHGYTLCSRPPGIRLVLHRLHVRFYVFEPLLATTGRSPRMRRF
jgi:hypothetical protein